MTAVDGGKAPLSTPSTDRGRYIAEVMTYDMRQLFLSSLEVFQKSTGVNPEALLPAPTPFTQSLVEDGSGQDDHVACPGRYTKVVSKVIMKLLYGAQLARYDLLRPECAELVWL